MQNAVLMRVMHNARYLRNEFHRLPNRHRRALKDFVKLPAFDEFHAEIAATIALTNLVDGNDVGMIETGSSCCFAAKPLQMRSACPLARADDFQSDCAIETLLSRQINYTLTATADFMQQFVVAEFPQQAGDALARHGRRCWILHLRSLFDTIYSFIREQAKASLKKATRAASIWCVSRDFRPAL